MVSASLTTGDAVDLEHVNFVAVRMPDESERRSNGCSTRLLPAGGMARIVWARCANARGTAVPLILMLFLSTVAALAHPMDDQNAAFVQAVDGVAVFPFMYLGAKHMVTGYDHLLFLVGVIFFLYRLRDVVLYVSLFTLGHSATLLVGVLGGIGANAYVVDAIIGLSVAYKMFDNLGGFGRLLKFQPNPRAAVLVFGLFHGFGLATKVQEFTLSEAGLLPNMLSFNVGVEVGQVLALTMVLMAFSYWRSRGSFQRYAFAANVALMTAGFVLAGNQMLGYVFYT